MAVSDREKLDPIVTSFDAEDIAALEAAAVTIDGEAICLRMAHTKGEDNEDWGDEEDAEATYHEMRTQAAKLYLVADKIRIALGVAG